MTRQNEKIKNELSLWQISAIDISSCNLKMSIGFKYAIDYVFDFHLTPRYLSLLFPFSRYWPFKMRKKSKTDSFWPISSINISSYNRELFTSFEYDLNETIIFY